MSEIPFSVIIPIGPGDEALAEDCWQRLQPELTKLPTGSEIFFVGTSSAPPAKLPVRWLTAERGRAKQMNAGAREAKGLHLWFLHADSRLSPDAVFKLRRSVEENPKALHYFRLAFESSGVGGGLTSLNAVGANLRSRYLKMPFGDQGFCLARELFNELGCFSEECAYGEDHLLVWTARRRGLVIREVPATVFTSPRKYEQKGWLRTTLQHWRLTVQQAVPEALELAGSEIKKGLRRGSH